MKYNAPPGSQDPNAPYVNGIPGVQKGSPVNANAVEYPQREILSVVTAAGLTPTNNDLTQLLQAIVKIIGVEVPLAEVGTPGIMSPDGKTCTVDARGVLSVLLATAVRAGLVKPDGVTITIKADGTISAVQPTMEKYDLCEFYYFRHPTLKPGFQPMHGGLLANAATLYPEAWAYLQTTEGKKLCKTEAQWQAMTTTPYYTLADGTKISFDGIGGAPFFAPNLATGALRMPDVRGMYIEAAGDSLSVGGVHLDAIRNIVGAAPSLRAAGQDGGASSPASGVLRYIAVGSSVQLSPGTSRNMGVGIDTSLAMPTAAKNQPRAWGALACVYLGAPK